MNISPWLMTCLIAALAWTSAAHADMEIQQIEIFRSDGKVVNATAFGYESGAYRVRILATSAHKTTDMQAKSGVSIRQASELPVVAKLLRREALVVNGGFSGSGTDIPVGLLITDGYAASGPSYASREANANSPCPLLRKKRLRHVGLLCVDSKNRMTIGRIDQVKYEDCQQALQSGPLLIEDGTVAVCPAESNESRHFRTVVCTQDQYVKIILTDPLTLHELASALTSTAGSPKGQCTQALNLSGDSSSGALYSYPARKIRKWHEVGPGPGTFPLPSILIFSRL